MRIAESFLKTLAPTGASPSAVSASRSASLKPLPHKRERLFSLKQSASMLESDRSPRIAREFPKAQLNRSLLSKYDSHSEEKQMVKRKAVVSMVLVFLILGANAAFSQVSPATLYYFPQLAVGQTGDYVYQTVYTLINPGTAAAQVKIEFCDDGGDPLSLEFKTLKDDSLGRKTSVDLTIPPNTTVAIYADNSLSGGLSYDPLKTGWAKVTSSVPVWASSTFALNLLPGYLGSGHTVSAVGVPPVTSSQQFTIFAFRDFPEGEPNPSLTDVGVAVANPSDAAATLTATLFDINGVQLAQGPISLPPRGHTAKFTGEMFPTAPSKFAGKIVVTSATPFAMMNLLIEGTLMTSLPVFRQ